MRRVWLGLVTLASLAGIFFGMLYGPLADAGDILWPLTWVAWPVVGWVILNRRPENRIGIICLLIGVAWGVSFALQAIVGEVGPEAAVWVELMYTMLGVFPWILIVWVLIVFPTGTYAGQGERILGGAVLVVGVAVLVGFVFAPTPLTDSGTVSPLAIDSLSWLIVLTGDAGFLIVPAMGLLAIVALLIRWRGSSGIERLQYQWLMLGGSLFVVISAAGQVFPDEFGFEILWLLGGSAIPLSIGIAVVRYRLYEIDRVVSRTVGYALVVGSLGLVFFAAVTVLTSVLPPQDELAVAGSTLAVAALFNPVRKRLLTAADRRFNRSRYDLEQVVERFSRSLRDRVDPDEVIAGWVELVAETIQPSAMSVWVRET